MNIKADMLLETHVELAEGPIWDPDCKLLYWVNIMAKEVHSFDPATGSSRSSNKIRSSKSKNNGSSSAVVSLSSEDPEDSFRVLVDKHQRIMNATYEELRRVLL